MFEIPTSTEARLASVTNRVERHGDEDKPAVSLGIELTAANTLLDCIDPKIREALYKAVEGQDTLPGVEPSTPVLRCNAFDRHVLTTVHEGWTLAVEDGIDEEAPMRFGSAKVDKFSVEAKQGGSVVLRFRVGTSDVDADKLGKLAMHNGQDIWITLTAPTPGQDAIDGSAEAFAADHPDAGDLFAQAQDDEDAGPDLEDRLDNAYALADGPGDESDSEGGDPDVRADGDWPFPDGAATPSPVPAHEVVADTSKRTARGRAATRAALDVGQPT